MKRFCLTSIACFFMIFSVCSPYPVTAEENKNNAALHFLIEGEGTSLSRSHDAGYIPVFVGTQVQRGDLIRPEQGRTVKILCSDLSLHEISKKSPLPCSDENSLLFVDGFHIEKPMGSGSIIPYILHPRRTAILDQNPLLRWYDTGASSYTVKIMDEAINLIWQDRDVKQNESKYPGHPELKPGKEYLLLVTDNDTGSYSGNDPMDKLGFHLLDDQTRKKAESYVGKINLLNLPDESKSFAIAMYYTTQGVYGEALSLLNGINSNMLTPAMELWRGHIYGEMSLYKEAETAYNKSLNLAKTKGDIYTQAQAADGLWCVTRKQEFQNASMELYKKSGEYQFKSLCER
ncbi:hypothetical protein [Candidatus Electrothrix sp.]|uniref:hypothetical protein n=1 Tax=Candidatus Electrothrix sp. TaxID=2170559 RepID=UPI004056A081